LFYLFNDNDNNIIIINIRKPSLCSLPLYHVSVVFGQSSLNGGSSGLPDSLVPLLL